MSAEQSGGTTQLALPSQTQQRRAIDRLHRLRENLDEDRPRYTLETERPDYSDPLEAALGIMTRLPRHRRILLPLLLAPIYTLQYRLDGERYGSDWAEDILVSLASNLSAEIFNKP